MQNLTMYKTSRSETRKPTNAATKKEEWETGRQGERKKDREGEGERERGEGRAIIVAPGPHHSLHQSILHKDHPLHQPPLLTASDEPCMHACITIILMSLYKM